MRKLICEVRLTAVSYPDSISIEIKPVEYPAEPWKHGKARSWIEMKEDLEQHGHNLDGAEEAFASGKQFLIPTTRLHYY